MWLLLPLRLLPHNRFQALEHKLEGDARWNRDVGDAEDAIVLEDAEYRTLRGVIKDGCGCVFHNLEMPGLAKEEDAVGDDVGLSIGCGLVVDRFDRVLVNPDGPEQEFKSIGSCCGWR